MELRNELKQEIQQKATEYFNDHPDFFQGDRSAGGILDLGGYYFDERNEAEVQRDEELGIDSDDYISWCQEAWNSWKSEKDKKDIKDKGEEDKDDQEGGMDDDSDNMPWEGPDNRSAWDD